MTTCKTCGQEHPRCTAHNRAGKPCGKAPQPNQQVCHLHGGLTPGALVLARSRALEDEARKVIAARWAHDGDQPVTDPLAELARVAGEVVAWKDYLREQTADLNGALAYWVDRDYMGPDGEVARSEAVENLRAVVVAYERAQDRAARVLADMVKLDIAGRLADVQERQATLIVAAVRAGVAMVALDKEQRDAVLSAVADQLEQITVPDVIVPGVLEP